MFRKVVFLVYPYAGGWAVTRKNYTDGRVDEDPYSSLAPKHEDAVREAIQNADKTVLYADVTEVYDLDSPPWEIPWPSTENTPPGARRIYCRRRVGRVQPREGAGESYLDCLNCGERAHWGLPCPRCGGTAFYGDQARDQPPLGFDSREQLRRYKETLGLDPDEETP